MRDEHYRQASIDSDHTYRSSPVQPARRPPPQQQQQQERAYSPAPSEAASYASYASPPPPPAQSPALRQGADGAHARRTSHGSVDSYSSHARAAQTASARQRHLSEREREPYASPGPQHQQHYQQQHQQSSEPVSQQDAPPSEYSAAGEYGSYMPPPSSASSELELESEYGARGATASYQSQVQAAPPSSRYPHDHASASSYDGSAFEPVSESRVQAHGREVRPARQASLESHYTSVSARAGEGYGLPPPVPAPAVPYGAAVPYHAQAQQQAYYQPSASSLSGSATTSPPRTNGAPKTARGPQRRPIAAATKPKHTPLNILDLADDDALSVPGSPSSPSTVSTGPAPSANGHGTSSSSTTSAPPPVPPNPALLALRTRVHSKLSSALSHLASTSAAHLAQLDLMRVDLEKAVPAIEDEMARLEAVRSVCETVRGRYEGVVGEAEGRLREYEARGEGVDVDEIVCGSTVVYTQCVGGSPLRSFVLCAHCGSATAGRSLRFGQSADSLSHPLLQAPRPRRRRRSSRGHDLRPRARPELGRRQHRPRPLPQGALRPSSLPLSPLEDSLTAPSLSLARSASASSPRSSLRSAQRSTRSCSGSRSGGTGASGSKVRPGAAARGARRAGGGRRRVRRCRTRREEGGARREGAIQGRSMTWLDEALDEVLTSFSLLLSL